MLTKKTSIFVAHMFLVIFVVAYVIHLQVVHALVLTTLSDTQSSLKVNNPSDHTIQFVTQTGLGAGEGFSITFPLGYATGTFSIANIDVGVSSSPSCSSFSDITLAGLPSGTTWGASLATSTFYFTVGSGAVPANRCIQVKIGSNAILGASGATELVNPSTPGQYVIALVSEAGDTGLITEHILPDDTVSISGIITQSLTFTISTSTIYFGNLGAFGAKYASSTNTSGDTNDTVAHTLSVGTNAPFGFTLVVRGQTLTSEQNPANTISVIGPVAASSTPGTEQFGLRASESGGVGVSVAPPFNMETSYGYAAGATTSEVLATGSGSTPMSTLGLSYVVNISTITEAGSYVANLVYVATANF